MDDWRVGIYAVLPLKTPAKSPTPQLCNELEPWK